MAVPPQASLDKTLQGGYDPEQAQVLLQMQALAAQQQQALEQSTQAAQQGASQAAQAYQQAAAQPAPGPDFAQFLTMLGGNTASVLGGTPSYRENAQQVVQKSRAEQLKQRADNLQALQDTALLRAKEAQKAGDLETEHKFRTQVETLQKQLDIANANHKRASDLEDKKALLEIEHQSRMAEDKAKPAGGGGAFGQSYSETDPKAIADGIIRGDLPPNLSQYSRLAQGPVATQLARQGFNLTRAQQDFSAVQRHFATLNGRLQLQIRQSANTVTQGLDDVEKLAKRLAELQPQFRNTPLNALTVKASREWGLMSPEAQDVATQLNGQIATLIPELSNIYSAGGVPTTEAMKLAGRVLHADWPVNRIMSGVQRERANLQYRINSINQVGAALPSQGGFEPPAAGGGGAAPQLISVEAPNGKTYHFPSQQAADEFKRKAGIK